MFRAATGELAEVAAAAAATEEDAATTSKTTDHSFHPSKA